MFNSETSLILSNLLDRSGIRSSGTSLAFGNTFSATMFSLEVFICFAFVSVSSVKALVRSSPAFLGLAFVVTSAPPPGVCRIDLIAFLVAKPAGIRVPTASIVNIACSGFLNKPFSTANSARACSFSPIYPNVLLV